MEDSLQLRAYTAESFIRVEEQVSSLILQVIGAEFEFLCEILLKPANILFPTNSVPVPWLLC